MDENKQTHITNLSSYTSKEKEQFLRDVVVSLLNFVEQGKSREEIFQILYEVFFKDNDVVDMEMISQLKRIIDKAFIVKSKAKGNDFHVALQDLLNKLDEAQKFLYKGKDGKDYSDRTTVDIMDEDYKNQLYTENQSKHM